MNTIFKPRGFFHVPDGTEVSPFLNATDGMQQDVPWGALGSMSIAAGRIAPGVNSWIHVHPLIAQVTYVLSGRLDIRMKDEGLKRPYDLTLQAGCAALTPARTLFQLRNPYLEPADVLYIASPSFVFEQRGGEVLHNDAVMLARTWEDLKGAPPGDVDAYEASARRAEALRRLALSKGVESAAPLAEPKVLALRKDYLAPDGSEIRLLADGPSGGLAHCTLPAGSAGEAVRHRTVDELWYVLEGEGELWRSRERQDRLDPLLPGASVLIPVGTSFQFRASEKADLKVLIATIPPWPGAREALPVPGKWPTRV